jgi:hypothetical protein
VSLLACAAYGQSSVVWLVCRLPLASALLQSPKQVWSVSHLSRVLHMAKPGGAACVPPAFGLSTALSPNGCSQLSGLGVQTAWQEMLLSQGCWLLTSSTLCR